MATISAKNLTKENSEGGGRLWVVILIILMAGILSGFIAINDYAAGTSDIVKRADRNAERFEMVFRDLLQGRFRAMNLAAEVMLQSRVTVEAFARGDRESLVNRKRGKSPGRLWSGPDNGLNLGLFRDSVGSWSSRYQILMSCRPWC